MKCEDLKAEPMIINDDYTALYYPKDSVDAAIAELKAENRKLKRALWMARAERARDNSILLPSKFMRNVWDNVERKCRAKAKEYK